MSHNDGGTSSLRRQRTLEVVENDDQRLVKRTSRTLTKKSSSTNKSLRQNEKSLSREQRSIQKISSASLSKKASSLSKQTSKIKSITTAKAASVCSLTNKNTVPKQTTTSNSMSAKDAVIARLSKQSSSKSVDNGVELWYRKGSFVATRAADGDGRKFYLCIILQDIYNFTKKTKVRWLDAVGPRLLLHTLRYKMKYLDWIDPACILLEVQTNQLSRLFYELPPDQHLEIMKVVQMVEDFEKGKLKIKDIDNDVHEVIQVNEPQKKKAKLTKTAGKKDTGKKASKKKVKLVKTSSQKLKEKAKKTAKKKEKSEKKPKKKKEEKEPKRKKATPEDELKLKPRPDVKVLDKDPLFETSTPMPYVSKLANSKLIFRAIFTKDEKLLRKLLKDKNKIYELSRKSVDCNISTLEAAVRTKNRTIFRILLQEYLGDKFSDRKKNNWDDKVSIEKLDTGQYNPKSLGISRILKLQASRGSKEGNNAFLKYETQDAFFEKSDIYFDVLAQNGLPGDFVEDLQKFDKETEDRFYNSIYQGVHSFIQLILAGHNKAAGKMISCCTHRIFRRGFNQLMKEVLQNETEELSGCAPSSVKLCFKLCERITAIHYASINPNSKYLEKLLSVEPLAHISDDRGRRPIHFAACCSSKDNLELLFKCGANLFETCQNHKLPLHYAIEAKRPENVKFILQKESENIDSGQLGLGASLVNRNFPNGMSPLHRAVELEQTEIVDVLLSYGAPVNTKSTVRSMMVTSLMKAAGTGNLDIVKLLINHGAVVEQKDRLGRTALIHACMNGATKVLSYLVHIGSNPERPDSSENYPIHYAAAYGWLFTLQFLIDVGVNINVLNMWKFSPVSVAFVKGHVGIARELLKNDKVDINQTMEDGTSLLFQACESDPSQEDLYAQIEYLVKKKGARCDIRDVNGKTALFYLANSTLEDKEKTAEAEKQSIKIADLLIANGCDLSAIDDNGFTAVMEALGSMANIGLAEALLKKGCKVLGPAKVSPEEEPKSCLLHRIIDNCDEKEEKAVKVMQLLTKFKFHLEAKEMAGHIDAKGYTPLLYACSEGVSYHLHEEHPPSSNFNNKQEEKNWDKRTDMFKYLITTFQSDVNAKVAEKFISLEDRLSVNELLYKYTNFDYGGQTALHMLLSQNPQFELIDTVKATRASLIIRHLVENGADIDYYDIKGKTPLGTVIENGYVSSVDFLIKHGKCDVNLPVKFDKGGGRIIEEHPHIVATVNATHHKFLDLFSLLIDAGINVNAKAESDWGKSGTFLHILLQKDDINRSDLAKIVDKLSKTSYNFNAQDDTGKTVMHYVLRSNSGKLNDSLELESKLMSRCLLTLKDKKLRTPLHYIFKKKKIRHSPWNRWGRSSDSETSFDPSQLLHFVFRNADYSLINKKDHDGRTIIHMAAEKGLFVCINILTKRKERIDISLKDIDGNTALNLAVKNKHDGCALALIQCGASLKDDIVTVSGDILSKRKQERKDMAKKTIQRKEIDDENMSDEDNDSSEGNDDDLEDKFENDRKCWTLKAVRDVWTIQDDFVKQSLYMAAISGEMSGTVLQIADAPQEKSGISLKNMICIAMECGKYNIVLQIMNTSSSNPKSRLLLSTTYEKGRNLLHLLPLSCDRSPDEGYNSLIEIAKFLIGIGISPDSTDIHGCTPIQYAILNRHFILADYLADSGSGYDVSRKDKFGRGILATVLWRIHSREIDATVWEFIEKIISKKLNLDVLFDLPLNPDVKALAEGRNTKKDPDYWQSYPKSKTTALIAAITCTEFSLNVSHNLLKFGANPNIPDGNNVTPLMHAVMQNKTDFVRQLLHYDYDPRAVDTPDNKKEVKQKKREKVNTSIFRLRQTESDASESDMDDEDDDDEENDKKKKENQKEQKGYKPVKKTSCVKLDQKDNDGRTALHYVASPFPLGTFDNAELAFVLIKGGAKSMTDKFGFTPFTLAVETCATNVIEKLRELGHGSNKSVKIQYNENFHIDDGINFNGKLDFMKDADKVLRRHDSGMAVDDVYIHEVDDQCNVPNGELMKDKELDVWYDILMTKVDVKRFHWGLYNFYKLQLVYQPDKKLYIIFTRWGRIGESGQFQHTPFHDEAAAVKEFAKIFRQKSGNKWTDIKNYERKPKRYRLLEDVARKAPPEQKDVKLDLTAKISTTMPQHLYSLINILMSPKIMELSMKSYRCVNTASLPFGQLNRERLLHGKQLLERIQKYIEEVEEYNKTQREQVDKEKLEVFEKNCEMIAELSNDYFHVIPQQNFSFERCEPLNARTLIEHLYFVSNMLNYEIVSKMLMAAMTNKSKINPVDYVYRCLGCKMELMHQDDPMSQLILRYVHSSSACKVFGIYKLCREGEEERLKSTKLGNHRLLWHGTRPTNLLSILSRGMLVSPPDARHNAWAYGKGIYFSDIFNKSDGYVHNERDKRSFMLLCQVALGNCKPFKDDDDEDEGNTKKKHDKKPKNSTVVKGYMEDDLNWLVLNSGVRIPYGKPKFASSHYSSTEYIVENPAQICLRYLIEYKKQ